MFANRCVIAVLSLLVAGALPAQAAGDGHGASAQERAGETPPGPWQGNWHVTRMDPRIRTLGGADLLRLQIIQDQGSSQLDVEWVAGPAICEDPLGDPCEWVGAYGNAIRAREMPGGGLEARLPVSADQDDPFILTLPSLPPPGGRVEGRLSNTHGDLNYPVSVERLP